METKDKTKNTGAESTLEICPLCGSNKSTFFFEDSKRVYMRCVICDLIFVPPSFHVSREMEKARYEEHNNAADDAGYRDFLIGIIDPVKAGFPKGATGLDFGCGPTPVLAKMLADEGFKMEVYDPFYQSDKKVLAAKYDFIVSTEVVEHLSEPLKVFKSLFSILKQGGMLAVMTQPYSDSIDFSGWHYKNDGTHICFYSINTFDWISEHFGIKHRRVGHDIFVFEP